MAQVSLSESMQPVLRALRHGKVIDLQRSLTGVQPVVRALERRIEARSGAAHRKSRALMRAIVQTCRDLRSALDEGSLLPTEMTTAGQLLQTAVDDYIVTGAPSEGAAPLDAAALFAGGEAMASRDRQTLLAQTTKRNPHPMMRCTRSIMVKSVPFVTDEEIARTRLKSLRVVDGFTLLRGCRIIAWMSKPGDLSHDQFADELVDGSRSPHTRCPMLCHVGGGKQGINYAWCEPAPDAAILFNGRDTQAWYPVGA